MESLFQALASAADGAFVIDENQHIIYWNQAAQEILGYAPEDVLGQSCYEVLGGCDDRGRDACRLRGAVAVDPFDEQVLQGDAPRRRIGRPRHLDLQPRAREGTGGELVAAQTHPAAAALDARKTMLGPRVHSMEATWMRSRGLKSNNPPMAR